MFPQINTPNEGWLTEAELDRIAAKSGRIYMLPGRDTCNGTCETARGCACVPSTVMTFPAHRITPAEACTSVGADQRRPRDFRRLAILCTFGWLLAWVAFIAVATFVAPLIFPN